MTRVQTALAVRVLAIVAIASGIVFRFADLGTPLFWQDEQYTSLYATGHRDRDVRALFDGRVHSRDEFARFGRIEPGLGAANVVSALRDEDPQHPPAFYLLEHATLAAIGSTIVDFRILPAVLGTLAIPLAALLGRRLFLSETAGLVAAAVFALSPIFVLYSRQAREYGLFVDDVLIASIALLAALGAAPRVAPLKWLLYAATLVLGLYTHPLFTIAIGAHAVTVLLEPGPRVRRMSCFVAAVAAAVLAYLPWVTHTVRENLDWAAVPYPFSYVAAKAGFNAAALAFDAEFRFPHLTPVAILIALGILLACVVFVRRGGAARRFVVPLALSAIVATGVRDLALGSHVSSIPRYLTPSLAGLEFALAGALAGGLASPSTRARGAALVAFAIVMVAGAASALVRGASPNWWDNNDQVPFQAVAQVASRSPRPLLIASSYLWIPRELALYTAPDARFVAFMNDDRRPVPALPADGTAYLVAPTREILERYRALARGRYRVDNLSPARPTLITSFHRDVASRQPGIAARSVFADVRPDESLFRFVPLARRATPKR